MTPNPSRIDFDTRKALLFALTAERLAAFYEHEQWLTDAQGASLLALWLSRTKQQLLLSERKQLSALSDQFARHLAATLSREAGLYTAHDMTEALDPNHRSPLAFELLDECERLLHEQAAADGPAATPLPAQVIARTSPQPLTAMTDITIYHNPACGTSRNTLALIRNSGAEPRIIAYLETPPSRDELRGLITAMQIPVRELLRAKGDLYEALGLADPSLSDEALLDHMLAHPILINRPIVVTPLGTRLCRPSERVLDILPTPQGGAFSKEDGEQVIDEQGRRAAKPA